MNDDLTQLVSPILAQENLELDELKVVNAGRTRVVKISVDGDGPEGKGPDLDQISDLTRKISKALDECDLMNTPYTLEVSSRGVSKPLTKPAHFRRNVGHLVRLLLVESNSLGKGEILGRIVSANDDAVTLTPHAEPGAKTRAKAKQQLADVAINYADITKAVVQVEMNR